MFFSKVQQTWLILLTLGFHLANRKKRLSIFDTGSVNIPEHGNHLWNVTCLFWKGITFCVIHAAIVMPHIDLILHVCGKL